jgi:hypothetical protein
MRILLDHCVDYRFKKFLPDHEVQSTKDFGWETLSNGKLLAAAEEAGFDVFLTIDKNLRHQQNLGKLNLAVITLSSRFTALEDIGQLAPMVSSLLDSGITPGTGYVITEDS